MPQTISQIRCPNCSTMNQVPIDQLIDVGQDPSAKARLLSGSLNTMTCSACGYQGQIATPMVYHDPENELLLTFIPVEMGLPKDEQDRLLGSLINQAIQGLQPEQRKGYLFQPQTVLTMQSLVERILEADGITKEEIESQRAKLQLFEQLLQTPDENLDEFVKEHDEELDAAFFQLASLSLQATSDEGARAAADRHLREALALSNFGKDLIAREAEIRTAVESLQEAGDSLTIDSLLDIFIEAPNEDRIRALVQLTRPAIDYVFFQKLTEFIDSSEGDEKQRLSEIREVILEETRIIDEAQEARAAQAAALLRSLMEAEDIDQAIRETLPLIDELFLGILQANIRAATERGDEEAVSRLQFVDEQIRRVIRESLPAGLQLAQDLLEIEDLAEAESLLDQSADAIDEEMLTVLLTTAQRLEGSGDNEGAERVRQLHRHALRLSMKSKLQKT